MRDVEGIGVGLVLAGNHGLIAGTVEQQDRNLRSKRNEKM